jgi:hypothetical protein
VFKRKITSSRLAFDYVMFGLFVKLAFAYLPLILLLAGCGQRSDSQMQKKLVGTWVLEETYAKGGDFKSTITVAADGVYSCDLVTHNSSNVLRNFTLEGTWKVTNGVLVDITTKHSNTNAPLPLISTAEILRLDGQELVLIDYNTSGVKDSRKETIFRRTAK